MVGKKNIRSYEVSIWTLQDSFITVLKPLNLEHKGAIQDGKITLQDDGENRISFSIPMYIREKGEFVENPLWYNTEDGNLIANLRKLKVIFNKKTVDEKVFEFIITKVAEKHEGFEKTCEIEGEGLAFNELGKQGYKISLSEEDLNYETKDLNEAVGIDDVVHTIYIKNNLNYWVDKVLAGTNWSYSIQMDWSIVDGVIDQYEEGATGYSDLTEEQRATLNFNRESNGLRRHDRIYEDAYVSSWNISNNTLIPAAVVESTEKLRMVEGEESNRYNLLQSIAEAFEVYTKYKYYYDNNYHIVDREVIFYNNFLDEDNTIDLTYDYDTQSISRELDATDIVTKMYVKTLDDESYPSGLASIADTNANKTGEDYILNFDYLYDIKTINDEQYVAIKIFEKDIANLNKQIKPLDTSIIKLESKLIDREVARDNALSIMKEAEENINFITEQLKAITEDSNYSAVVKVVKENPAFIFLSKNNSNYLGKFGSQFSGIIPGTVKVYSDSTCTTAVSFSQKIKNNMVQSLIFSNAVGSNASNGYLYATFDYKPALEKEKLREDYQTLYNKNKKIYETNLTKVSQLEDLIKTKKTTRENLYNNKTKLISDFENMMGPALREGNWQPEDEYVGYGDQYDENIQPLYSSAPISTKSGKLKFIWDKELFDEEEKNYYEYGINQQKVYYPCINLTKINSNIFEKLKEEEFRNGLSFVYKDSNETNPYLLPQGTNCKFAFIQPTSGGDIIPVLMITNLYNETNITNNTTANTALTYLKSLISYIVYITDINIILNTITVNNSTVFSVPSGAWIDYPNNYNIVYPRLEIQSDLLKTGANELLLNIYREKADPTDSTGERKVYTYINKLKEFTDYSLFSKDEKKYITIKPEVLLAGKIGEAKIKINYCLANTALQIYLDAIEIMKENAYPKASYTINQLFSPKLFHNTYDRLGQLAHINDAKLKFKNVMGYISAVELDLDKPWEDSITIQNYKNKFEDLFSTIVAQTENMKKNAYRINAAANAFSANGLLTAEVTPESLLKSARVLNNLIKNNADVITAKAVGEAAKNKAALASTDAYRIMHGEVGLAFKGNKIDSVVLNQDKGLIVAGKTGTTNVFFQLDNAEMGFFKGIPGTFNETNPAARPVPQLYYENGNLTLSGVMYAASGWFGGENGWIIGSNELSSPSSTTTITGLGGLLYSANGKAIFTSEGGGTSKEDPMIVLTKTGFSLDKQNAALLFDGTNLYINGTITSTAGNIGGWYIGEKYLGSGVTRAQSVVGMSNYDNENSYAFWAGAEGVDSTDQDQITVHSPKFSVTKNGSLTSTKGFIAGWALNTTHIGNNAILNSATVGMASNSDATYSFWAGGAYNATPKFSVTPAGILTAKEVDISGIINATSGSIGGWTLSSGSLFNATTIKESTVGLVPNPSNETYPVLWIGGGRFSYEGYVTPIAPFRVTKAGKLYATGAIINGNTSITAANVNITGTGNGAFTVDMSNFKVANNGDVTVTGKITAKDGSIAGWTIGNGYITTNTNRTSYNVSSKGMTMTIEGIGAWNDANNYFTLSATDGLTAKGANITGALTATSLTVGDSNTMTYSSSNGLKIGSGDNYLEYKNSTLTVKGSITATSGTFTGAINARSGKIGQENAPQITIGSSGNTSTSVSWIYSGNKSTLTSDTLDGFYLGTNGLALGKGLFKVTDSGVLTAKSGTIGGWTIGDALYLNGATPGSGNLVLSKGTKSTNSIGGSPANTEKTWMISASNKFGVTTTGDLYAIGATISGALTATSLTVGNGNSNTMTYSSTNGLQIGSGDNYLKYVSSSGLTIKGDITATSGKIGSWFIGSTHIGTSEIREISKVGLSYVPSAGVDYYVFWAGNANEDQNVHEVKRPTDSTAGWFGVTSSGKISARNADISGALTATTLSTGSRTTSSAGINGTFIDQNGAIYVGKTNAFTVTSDGAVTATSGSIGGWTIGSNFIGNGSTRKGGTNPSTVGMSCLEGNTAFVFWAGGQLTDGSDPITSIPFYVRANGSLCASKGYIGGWTISNSAIYKNTNSKTSTTAGIYLGPDAIRAYSSDTKYVHIEGGKITAKDVDISGAVTANTGYIGGSSGWEISSNLISSGTKNDGIADGDISLSTKDFTRAINKIDRTNLRFAIGEHFGVSKNGTLYATNAILSGSLTSGSDFSVTSKGVLTAKKGSIGGWTIGDNYIGTGTTRGNSIIGMSNYTNGNNDDTKLVFWAGNPNTNNTSNSLNAENIPFSVNRAGVLNASKINITGGEFSINCSKDFQIYNPETDKYDITWAYRGKVSINKNFKVVEDDLYADSPCPLYIEENFNNNKSYTYLWNGQLRFASKKDGSYNTMISNSSIETPLIYTYYKATAGAADSNSSGAIDLHGNYIEIMDFSDTSDSTNNVIKMTTNKNNVGLSVTMKTDNDFYSQEKWLIRKNKNGNIYIDGAISDLCSISSLNKTYKIIVSTGNTVPEIPTYVERVLWIKPDGSYTESGNIKYRSCNVYWIQPK